MIYQIRYDSIFFITSTHHNQKRTSHECAARFEALNSVNSNFAFKFQLKSQLPVLKKAIIDEQQKEVKLKVCV